MDSRFQTSKSDFQLPETDSSAAVPPPAPRRHVILLVDDGDETRLLTKWFLANFGYDVDTARTAEEGLLLFDPKIHDLIVTDNSMPGMSGVEMAHIIKLRSPSTPVLMYTGRIPERHSCVDVVIQRPTHLVAVKDAIERLLTPSL